MERLAQSRSRYITNVILSKEDRQRQLLSMAHAWVREKSLAEEKREEESRLTEGTDRLNDHSPVAAPPDATEVKPWRHQQQENGVWYRYFVVREWTVIHESDGGRAGVTHEPSGAASPDAFDPSAEPDARRKPK